MRRKRLGKQARELLLSNESDDVSSSLFLEPDFLDLFPLYKRDRDDYPEEQTFSEFVEIGIRPPNEEGTGRFRLTQDRQSIGILDLTTATTGRTRAKRRKANKRPKQSDKWEALRLYLACFFNKQLSIEMSPAALQLKKSANKKGRKYNLVDETKQIQFPLSSEHCNGTSAIEIWSVLLVLMEYVRPTEYCLVALVDVPLCEEFEDEVIHEVLGRACGDRVAVVNVTNSDPAELFRTVAHEILHCMGMDHTTTRWKCLMNPSVSLASPAFFLAPHNLRKLQLFLTNHTTTTKKDDLGFVLSRYCLFLRHWDVIFAASTTQSEQAGNWRNWLEGVVARTRDFKT